MPNLCNALGSSPKQEGKFYSFTCTLSAIIGQANDMPLRTIFLKEFEMSGH